jgi:alanine racemase
MLFLGYNNRFIAEGLLALSPVAMRLELVKGINGCTLINDSYNSDLYSLSIALDFLNQQNQHQKKTVILSDILQSGRPEKDLYREVSSLVRGKGIDRFIGVGGKLTANRQAFVAGSVFFSSTEEFLATQKRSVFRDEAILIKGSRQFEFEKIVHAFEQKVHRTVMEVDLEALVHNLNVYRSLLHKDTAIMVMVKALSYGSGSWEIANTLQFQKVDYLCVAYTDEGIHLRQAGIKLPVVVMNPELSGFDALVDHQLEPEIYSFRILEGIGEVVRRRKIDRYPVHLKLETGMHRLGFSADQVDELMICLRNHPRLVVASVFSHLAASDNPAHDDFSRAQIKQFDMLSKRIIAEFSYRITRHILNSSGIERFPEGQFDMVRLGIGLYGISENIPDRLRNVNTLKSILSQVRTISSGDSVGYNRQFVANSDMTIGTVPIGYADGFSRKLGNGNWQVSIKGKKAPVIGNICMDMCMVDLTDTGALEGDEVIIFGDDPTLKDMADKLETIPYEVLSRISERVKRVYFH